MGSRAITLLPTDPGNVKWFEDADEVERAAFQAFLDEGCQSCGKKALPTCVCWVIKKLRYMAAISASSPADT
jgi:16S rRNA U1498 N3-methylase RsmE